MLEKLKYSRKPQKCSKCGSKKIASILYGYPAFSSELKSDLDEEKTVVGGCCISNDDPPWECADCPYNDVCFRGFINSKTVS